MKQSRPGGFSVSPVQVNFKGVVSDRLPPSLDDVQRALYYGDALFESIRIFDGHVPLWTLHWERLNEGMHRLGMLKPKEWSESFFLDEMKKMNISNHRLRLMVWRCGGGLYLPQNDATEFMMTAQKLESSQYEWPNTGLVLGMSKHVRLPVDRFSNLKSLNTARYVQAAREASHNGWDDAVILNAYERVCETSNSNLFWIRQGKVYTPPESEGCVTGVLRKILLAANVKTLEFVEATGTQEILEEADEIFLTNAVRGIRPVHMFNDNIKKIDKTKLIYEYLIRYILNN